jgi:hypothetical protein
VQKEEGYEGEEEEEGGEVRGEGQQLTRNWAGRVFTLPQFTF